MKVALAELLLRRKELQEKVSQLKMIKDRDLFEIKARRQRVEEGVDDVVVQVPYLTASQVTSEYDWHARQLRKVDAAIQRTNWDTQVEVEPVVMEDYVAPEMPERKAK